MIETINKAGLIGISSPQIAQNYMMFVTHPRNTKSRKSNIDYEGCGSVVKGDLFGPVSRPEEIEVEALNEKGEKIRNSKLQKQNSLITEIEYGKV